jgi:TolB-like protein
VLSVAVLPLAAPAGDADASRFSEALTRYLLTGLPTKREYGHVLVVSAAPASGAGTRTTDPRELGRQFNVRYVLEGDVLRAGNSNTVNLRLVDTATRAQVWSGRETLQDADVASEPSGNSRCRRGVRGRSHRRRDSSRQGPIHFNVEWFGAGTRVCDGWKGSFARQLSGAGSWSTGRSASTRSRAGVGAARRAHQQRI